MRYHDITKDDMNNGDGLRVVLWVAGCYHRCPNCQNPITWDFEGGLEFDSAAETELFDALKKDYISGITFSGGDPLATHNREDVLRLMKRVKEECPEKTIWAYTGHQFSDTKFREACCEHLNLIDVLVDGPYIEALNPGKGKLKWKGSSNQNVIDVQATLEHQKNGNIGLILHCQ